MKVFFYFIAVLSLKGTCGFAQETSSKREMLTTVKAYIKGQQGKRTLDIDYVKAGLEIELSDPTYSVNRFDISWEDKKDNIVFFPVKGNRFNAGDSMYHIEDALLPSTLSFYNIIATKEGKEYMVPIFLVDVADLFNRYMSIKNPRICHDGQLRPFCYNDGTYAFYFEDSKFSGFTTADSSVLYNEKTKTITIQKLHTSAGLAADPIVIKLEKNALTCTSGNTVVPVNEINSFFTAIKGLNITMRPGKWFDTIQFKAGYQLFSVRISKNDIIRPKKGWRWEIVERHSYSRFAIMYNWKNNNPQFIFLSDERLKYGMSVSTSFKTGKHIWEIKSIFIEEIDGVVGHRPIDPKYNYSYNKNGRLNTRRSIGKVVTCNCL